MDVIFDENWSGADGKYSNHESDRDQNDILILIDQARELPGLKDRAFAGMPTTLRLFAENALFGNFRITVTKGIHQRTEKPHITVRFNVGGGKTASVELWLSQEVTQKNGATCRWRTVGMSCEQKKDIYEFWPGHFSVELKKTTKDFVQVVHPKLKRGTSVGCLKPGAEPFNG
jgi:hypothetical protein